jgi:predicted RNA-binding protein YlxR (DUF448 family)
MARDLSRTILCAATGCTKAGTIPKNRGKPNGWRYAEYLVNFADGRWVIPVEPVEGRSTFLCPACGARQDARRRVLAEQAAQARVEAQRAAQAAQETAAEACLRAEKAAEEARRAAPAPEGFSSWAPEVVADSSGTWCGNALRFATRGEAEDNVRDLSFHWMLVRDTRVVPSKDPVNYRYGPDGLVAV